MGYIVLFSVLCLLGWIMHSRLFHTLKDILGPFWASVSRFWLGYQVSTGKAEHTQWRLHERHGPLVRIAPDEVSVADPSSLRVIYGIKGGFTKIRGSLSDTDFYAPWSPRITPNGDNFSQQDEGKHAARRKLVNSVYSMSSVLESEQYIDACTDVLMGKMAEFSKTGQAIDLAEWIQWYTFNVIGELFFGQQFGFMRDEHDFGNYILSLDTLMPSITVMCVLPAFLRALQPLLGLPFPSFCSAVKRFDDIRHAGKLWVTHRMQQMARQEVDRSDILDKLFQVRQTRDGFDTPDIQTESFVAILAGIDTTAIAIRAILYYLTRTQLSYGKLIAEIDEADRDGRLSRPHVQYSEAIKLPYLVACCREGMRLHPSVGLCMPRYVPAGGRIIAGHFIPAGTKVGISPPVFHCNKDVFGPDAAEYNPERWLRDPKAAAEMDRHMLHFGAGTRTCIGKNISLAEIHKMIPQLLREYRLDLADPRKPWDTHNFWFNKQTGIRVYVTARQPS
ncbi:cytochrome P450 [Aspergillus aurantiobrunneus]